MQYSDKLIQKIVELYPDNKKIQSMAAIGDDFLLRYLLVHQFERIDEAEILLCWGLSDLKKLQQKAQKIIDSKKLIEDCKREIEGQKTLETEDKELFFRV